VLAYGWGLALVLLSAWPALLDPSDDSYPLSTYPMFSRSRGQPTLFRMVGIERDGTEHAVPPSLIANSETLQAAATLAGAVHAGRGASRSLCRKVASRMATENALGSVRTLEIRSVRFDPIDYFVTSNEPLEAKRVQRCRVRSPRP
jgi:hypothetical protein